VGLFAKDLASVHFVQFVWRLQEEKCWCINFQSLNEMRDRFAGEMERGTEETLPYLYFVTATSLSWCGMNL